MMIASVPTMSPLHSSHRRGDPRGRLRWSALDASPKTLRVWDVAGIVPSATPEGFDDGRHRIVGATLAVAYDDGDESIVTIAVIPIARAAGQPQGIAPTP